MTTLRLDNIGIVVDDVAATTAFFTDLGLEVVGETTVEGPWVDRVASVGHVALAVDDVDAAVAVARSYGATLLGDVVQYEDSTGSASCAALRASSSRSLKSSAERRCRSCRRNATARLVTVHRGEPSRPLGHDDR
ncbi:hypothetical protein [Luteimicrobium sp. DT211]|uniref:hypothetical protein n=1 Tax=Luteimicrobium sp. DT211 TaxID=3393412 RepID=UPI003CF35BA0